MIKNGESSISRNQLEVDTNPKNAHLDTANSEKSLESRLGENSETLGIDASQQTNPNIHLPEGFFDDPVQDAKVGIIQSIQPIFGFSTEILLCPIP